MGKRKKSLVFIKIGGSAITYKGIPYKVKEPSLEKISKQISKAKNYSMIIAHGSGSFGHTSASVYGGKKGYKNKLGIAKVAKDAYDINKIVIDSLLSHGVPAIGIRPMGLMTSSGGKLNKGFFEAIELMIKQNLVPVVFGDVIWDDKWNSTIFSGETIMNHIADYLLKKKYKIDKVIQIGETEGVYDNNKRTIKVINKKTWPKIKKFIKETRRPDVTGGMIHKVEEALLMTKRGVKTLLISERKSSIQLTLEGKIIKGTIVE